MNEITLHIPGDKSISHRAVIFGSLADGISTFKNFLASDDCLHTIQCFRELGVEIEQNGDEVTIHEVGVKGLKQPHKILDVGNSGTSIRLLTGVLAAQPFDSVITGDTSIQKRPMKRIIEPLRKMGAKIEGDEKGDNIYPPLRITGGQKLNGITYQMPVASAQVDSCIRLAGLCAGVEVNIDKQGMQYRDHTEKMQEWFHVYNQRSEDGDSLPPLIFEIPSDISSAAFFLVAGALLPDTRIILPGINTNPTRAGILDVLKRMGATVMIQDERSDLYLEGVANIIIESSSLQATTISGEKIPTLIDEIPIIALAAALAEGTTTISGARELRFKESDRLHTVATELNRVGANIEEKEDGLVIHGVGAGSKPALHGAQCKSYGDHRIAMMLKVANLVSEGEVTIDDDACIKTSFPGFGDLLDQLYCHSRESGNLK